eukprot:m.224782 g.224782  ORF g.224782 m.224782 type:complete len:68 (+) comp34465_c0_seq1:75-278(+)
MSVLNPQDMLRRMTAPTHLPSFHTTLCCNVDMGQPCTSALRLRVVSWCIHFHCVDSCAVYHRNRLLT